LLRFLHFHPYDDPRVLDNDIFSYLRDPIAGLGEGTQKLQEGTRRLQALCRPIMIRRSKTVISLPRRQTLIKTIEFTPEERWGYTQIETAASTGRENPTGPKLGPSTIWNKLQLISKLRVFCNLGQASCLKGPTGAEPNSRPAQGNEDAREAIISSQIALGGTCCVQCQGIIDTPNAPQCDNQPLAYYSACELVFCNSCASLCNYETGSNCKCSNNIRQCALRTLCLESTQGVEAVWSTLQIPNPQRHRSSKVCALVEEVTAALPEKRHVTNLLRPQLF
jgi:hypothetical protein